MRNALTIICELQRQGVRFVDQDGRLRVISPRGVVLSAAIKKEIIVRKNEILHHLHAGGIAPEDILAAFPGAEIVAIDVDLGTCAWCAGWRWWVSEFGIKSCGRCFPSARPELVVVWIGPTERGKVAAAIGAPERATNEHQSE